MRDTRKCYLCQKVKPLEDFPIAATKPEKRRYDCRTCRNALERERRRNIPAEDKAEAARAYRAGMRKDKCAVCGSAIEGHGICDQCADAVSALGGLAGLKQAVRAVRYLAGE